MKAYLDDEEITGINVTPLVDITLVLLIIFMVTASYMISPSIKVDLPRASQGEDTNPSSVSLVLTKDHELYLNGELTTEKDVVTLIQAKLKESDDLQAIIGADSDAKHGAVVHIIDLIKGAGVKKFALNIDKLDKLDTPEKLKEL